ncbi:uncharacterized protein [Battus philenor]|uniref:uncharacterized protein n=1 Tax=Battus philenor TaxID=42288 RepID=UPI0035CFB86D
MVDKIMNDDKLKTFSIIPETVEVPKNNLLLRSPNISTKLPNSTNLKMKLEIIVHNAKHLADSLKSQILLVQQREDVLKEAIFNGWMGVTTLTVTTLKRMPRKYIIRNGFWTLCNGIVQHPATQDVTAAIFTETYNSPKCIGQEVTTKPDPCVFNSIIKYDTVPTQRRLEYSEEEYLCLKSNFNNTLEQYFSVPKQLVNKTCKNGVIRSLADNISECSLRVISDYTYYPNKNLPASHLPLEYCEGHHGSCKLIVAWHLSNTSVENFEFIKDDPNFKSYFIKSGSYVNNPMY